MSLIRFPGGKSKLRYSILKRLLERDSNITEYREPFFGGGSIGFEFLKNTNNKKVWINDKDTSLVCLWNAVIKYPELLKEKVKAFVPSVEMFFSIKNELLTLQPQNVTDTVDIGFKKLAIHQISYSGLGTKSGGPLGGIDQQSKYKIDCRWSPKTLCKKIDNLHKLISKFVIHDNECSNLDFQQLLDDTTDIALVYLDPPYFVKGNDLYQCGFTYEDHVRLAESLRYTKHSWVLSYDDCPEIRELYQWAFIEELSVNYTINGSRAKKELLIYKANNNAE